MEENIGAMLEVLPQRKAPGMAWGTQVTEGVGIWVVTQLVVPAVMVIQVIARESNWVVSAQLGVIQVARQLEGVMVTRPVAMQVVKQVTPQATHVWIQVPAQVGTEVDHGHPFLPLWDVCEVVWILSD